MFHHKHFTINERFCIAFYLNNSVSIRKIAVLLNKSPSSVSREIRRNSVDGIYLPIFAQKTATNRKTNKPTNNKFINSKLIYILNKLLSKQWSPEQIVGRCKALSIKLNIVSISTIYRWIYKGLLEITPKSLRHKGKRRKKDTRGKFVCGRRISQRPKEVYKRNTCEHWECDTIVSSRGKSKYCIATMVERKSGLLIAKLLPQRTAENMAQAIIEALEEKKVKTITVDRGKEFALYEKIEKAIKAKIYFADAYCAWQKGTVENTNGLLRQYYPKKFEFNQTTQEELDEIVEEINNRPRKRLGYKTPKEIFYGCCI